MENNKPYIVCPCMFSEERKRLEELGIKIIESPGRGTFVDLPDGWTFKKLPTMGYSELTEIYDENGRGRILSRHYFPVKRYTPDDELVIYTRYFISRNADKLTATVVDRIDGSKLLFVGAEEFNNYDKREKKCCDYLDLNFPEWRNPLAYWD